MSSLNNFSFKKEFKKLTKEINKENKFICWDKSSNWSDCCSSCHGNLKSTDFWLRKNPEISAGKNLTFHQLKNYKTHRKNVLNAKPVIDTSPPLHFPRRTKTTFLMPDQTPLSHITSKAAQRLKRQLFGSRSLDCWNYEYIENLKNREKRDLRKNEKYKRYLLNLGERNLKIALRIQNAKGSLSFDKNQKEWEKISGKRKPLEKNKAKIMKSKDPKVTKIEESPKSRKQRKKFEENI